MLIGHEKQKKYLKNLVSSGSLGHAYLFTGPEMIGKRTFALDLFETINNRKFQNDPDFTLIGPDFSEGDAKIYIGDIRKLKSFFRFKPYDGYKFAVINDAHCLTNEASNALLKLLEEPPKFSVIILVSAMPKMLPATISSRCEEIRFSVVDEKSTIKYFESLNKKLKKEDRDFLIKISGGRIGLINYLLKEDGLADARKAVDDLRKLLNARVYEKFKYAKKIHENGTYQPLVSYWLNWVAAHVRTAPKNEKIVKELLVLNSMVSHPQYNHRLALENFLLNL